MNHIPEVQNSEKQLQRLAAQRELYSSAKKWHALQIILTVIIPVLLAIVALCVNSVSVWTAIFGVLSFVVDIAIIDPIINRRKEKAAKIQELFDCDVLEIPQSTLKVVDDIAVEEVLQYFNAYTKIATNIEKIKNWYSPIVGQLPQHIARILCQRTNCWWDSKLRRKYASFLKIIASIIFGGILLTGYIANLSLITVTLIASGLIPLFQFCIKQAHDNIETACRLDQLTKFSSDLWVRALRGESINVIALESRKLQDEIFEHRKKATLILDSYYKLFRDDDEVLMNKASEILVKEALSKMP